MPGFNHKQIESKWRKAWKEEGVYEINIKDQNFNVKTGKGKFYNLMMFPYPSAEGLHVGNMYAFTGADVYGRFKRMQGYQVFEPIGLDGFGIHSENYAIKIGKHPAEQAKVSEKRFYDQLLRIGNGFAWNNHLETYDPDYYRWTQWLFIQMFKRGLAYRGQARVNWCPSCKTVLADEQVEDGVCERCKTEAEKREMASWYFKITQYADRLLENIDGVGNYKFQIPNSKQIQNSKKQLSKQFGPVGRVYDPKKEGLRWPEKIKMAQRNWIGKKEGINIRYKIQDSRFRNTGLEVECFTTRPDTNFGATFVVLAPEHELVRKMQDFGFKIEESKREEIRKYVDEALSKSEQQRLEEGRKKTGVFTGLYALNQLTGYKMPVWITDFVLADVGTGAVVGVPGHDKRDFEFASEFKLEVKRVVVADGDESEITRVEQVQEDEGTMVNSDFLNGMDIHQATVKIMDYLEEKGWGKRVYNYHLRDWLISRQRYWGPPIPMIYCDECKKAGKSWFDSDEAKKNEELRVKSYELREEMKGWYPVPEEDLPVELPYIDNYKPEGDGSSPLANASEEWKFIKCPGCGARARRELDVSDTFLDSSWYFLRYPSIGQGNKKQETKNKRKLLPFDLEVTRKWLPVDAYIGGAEHAVLHLLYSRFVTMVLHDMGLVGFEEPFPFLFGHGLIIKDGAKMSKSRGNIVNPDEYIEKYGADTLRSYLMFLGPYEAGGDFRDTGIIGIKRFLNRVWDLYTENEVKVGRKTSSKLITMLHKTIKKVTDDLERFSYNTALAAIMEFSNKWREEGMMLSREDAVKFLKLLAPIAPHMTEELFQFLRSFNYQIPIAKQAANVDNQTSKRFDSVHLSRWPDWDEENTVDESVIIPVQVNGKLRGMIHDSRTKIQESTQEEIVEMAKQDVKVAKWLEGKTIVKEIWVPGRLVNLVVRPD